MAPAIPGLLGLPRDYLNSQFGAWRIGQRQAQEPDCMAQVARQLGAGRHRRRDRLARGAAGADAFEAGAIAAGADAAAMRRRAGDAAGARRQLDGGAAMKRLLLALC